MTYAQIKDVLNRLTDPVDKLDAVMDFGRALPDVPAGAVCSEITGCASRVSICTLGNNFYGTADSALVRGIVAILISMVDGKTPDEIKKMDLLGEFLGLNLNLGTGRLGGVNSMVRFLQNL